MEILNRIKTVLADSEKTNKCLAEQLGKVPVTISKWFTNSTQPDMYTIAKYQICCMLIYERIISQ